MAVSSVKPPDFTGIGDIARLSRCHSDATIRVAADDSIGSKRVPFVRTQTAPTTPSVDDYPTGKMFISPQRPARLAAPVLGVPLPTRSAVMCELLTANGSSRASRATPSGNEQGSLGIRDERGMRHYGLCDSSNDALNLGGITRGVDQRPAFSSALKPRVLQGTVEVHSNKVDGITEYGKGAWSVVYQAVYDEEVPGGDAALKFGLPSPRGSPVPRVHHRPGGRRMVAVKVAHKSHLEDAESVIWKEARILTYIQPFRFADSTGMRQEHVVTFLGFHPQDFAIVMEALPVTLSAFSQSRGRVAKENFSTRTMYDPVVGTKQWLVFAHKLITGLEYLQQLNIVHGDVKPMNILLRARDSDKSDVLAESTRIYDPVYCDFSSAHVVQDGIEEEPVSAVTTAYTAPELFEALQHRSGGESEPVSPICTYSSDVFSLGATLLVPAIGIEVYSDAGSSMRKLAIARHGQPLESARQSEQASRVMRGNLVDRVIQGAVTKRPDDRWDVHTWRAIVEEEMKALKVEIAQ